MFFEVRDLRVEYRSDTETVHAVNSISLGLETGQTLGIVGETGAGKTTTALAILRLLPERTGHVMGGQILFAGEDLLQMKPAEIKKVRGNRISMIFQDPMTALNPIITVGEQIAEALRLHNSELSREGIEQRVDEVLEMVGIPASRKGEYPHQFSGGMKQRVVIAMALVCSPDLLIADEPTTALDVTIQAQVLAMMNDLKQRMNTAMILITHDLGIVARTCDTVAVMYAGEIIETGTIFDLYGAHRHHPYTRGLFGSIPNLQTETRRLQPINGLMPDPTNLPAGCAFSPRCPLSRDICRLQKPPERVWDTHKIRCFCAGEEENHA